MKLHNNLTKFSVQKNKLNFHGHFLSEVFVQNSCWQTNYLQHVVLSSINFYQTLEIQINFSTLVITTFEVTSRMERFLIETQVTTKHFGIQFLKNHYRSLDNTCLNTLNFRTLEVFSRLDYLYDNATSDCITLNTITKCDVTNILYLTLVRSVA